jgi:hypothetical protein
MPGPLSSPCHTPAESIRPVTVHRCPKSPVSTRATSAPRSINASITMPAVVSVSLVNTRTVGEMVATASTPHPHTARRWCPARRCHQGCCSVLFPPHPVRRRLPVPDAHWLHCETSSKRPHPHRHRLCCAGQALPHHQREPSKGYRAGATDRAVPLRHRPHVPLLVAQSRKNTTRSAGGADLVMLAGSQQERAVVMGHVCPRAGRGTGRLNVGVG